MVEACRPQPNVSGTLDLPARAADAVPESQRTSNNTLLAWADQLPFKSNTLDYIVSLHNMEHLQDPTAAVLHYLVGCGCQRLGQGRAHD